MATKTFEELKQLAIQIRDEKTNKQNTATRVGTAMLEHINKLEQDYYDKTTINNRTSEYNVSINHPTSGISSSNKYDLSSAIVQVPAELRTFKGLKVSFINENGDTESWIYTQEVSGNFLNTKFWKKVGSDTLVINFISDVYTTRKSITQATRRYGLIISYNVNGKPVTEKFIGDNYSDNDWILDSNWVKILDENDYQKIENEFVKLNNSEIPNLKDTSVVLENKWYSGQTGVLTTVVSSLASQNNITTVYDIPFEEDIIVELNGESLKNAGEIRVIDGIENITSGRIGNNIVNISDNIIAIKHRYGATKLILSTAGSSVTFGKARIYKSSDYYQSKKISDETYLSDEQKQSVIEEITKKEYNIKNYLDDITPVCTSGANYQVWEYQDIPFDDNMILVCENFTGSNKNKSATYKNSEGEKINGKMYNSQFYVNENIIRYPRCEGATKITITLYEPYVYTSVALYKESEYIKTNGLGKGYNNNFVISMRNDTTFVGAINTMIDSLYAKYKEIYSDLSKSPRLIFVGNVYPDGIYGNKWIMPLIKAQQMLAEYWGAMFMRVDDKTGWINKNSINTLLPAMSDQVHPAMDWDGERSVNVEKIADILIPQFRQIRENWDGIIVNWIGHSIPAGFCSSGEYVGSPTDQTTSHRCYPVLIKEALGFTLQNPSKAGSVVRNKTSTGAAFTLPSSVLTAKRWIEDGLWKIELAKIGTEEEPLFWVFDIGYNDITKDDSDMKFLAE